MRSAHFSAHITTKTQAASKTSDDKPGFHTCGGRKQGSHHPLPRGAFLESLRAVGIHLVPTGTAPEADEKEPEIARRRGDRLRRFPVETRAEIRRRTGAHTEHREKPDARGRSAIDPADFENWKALLPLHTPSAVRTDGTTTKSQQPPLPAADAQGIGAYPSEASPAVPNGTRAAISDEALLPPAERTSDTALSAAHAVAERVRLFNLAESTPMECMLFISDLKKTLQTP